MQKVILKQGRKADAIGSIISYIRFLYRLLYEWALKGVPTLKGDARSVPGMTMHFYGHDKFQYVLLWM